MASVFFSYCHADEVLRDELEKHLSQLKREGTISVWHDRRIAPGDDLGAKIDAELDRADIVLLLVSSDFLASEYCYSKEMTRALERHNAGACRVVPIILRPCDWQNSPFGSLLALPTDGKPVTRWKDGDDAFLDVVKGIRKIVAPGNAKPPQATAASTKENIVQSPPRSSNLRVRKVFSQRDQDVFLDQAFEYMARFFEDTLEELRKRNPELETGYKRSDINTFSAVIYRNGATVSRCTIRNGDGGTGKGISIAYGTHSSLTGINESLRVESGEHSLYLRSLGMQVRARNSAEDHLSYEGASEYYWSLFIAPLQR